MDREPSEFDTLKEDWPAILIAAIVAIVLIWNSGRGDAPSPAETVPPPETVYVNDPIAQFIGLIVVLVMLIIPIYMWIRQDTDGFTRKGNTLSRKDDSPAVARAWQDCVRDLINRKNVTVSATTMQEIIGWIKNRKHIGVADYTSRDWAELKEIVDDAGE